MKRAIFCIEIFALAAMLSACASVPDLDPSAPTPRQIADEIQCEVFKAVTLQPDGKTSDPERRKSFIHNAWAAVANLTLQVDDSVQISPTLSYIDPLHMAGTSFTFGFGALGSQTRQRVYNESLTFYVDQLAKKSLGEVCADTGNGSRLSGDLRIREAVDTALDSSKTFAGPSVQTHDEDDHVVLGDDNKPKMDTNSNSFGETIQFVLTKNVNALGPTWTLTNFKGPGGLFGASRMYTQKLIITFAASNAQSKTGHGLFRAVEPFAVLSSSDLARMSLANRTAYEQRQAQFLAESHADAVLTATQQNMYMLLQSLHSVQ